MIRVYHNFMALEEYKEGMWRIVRGEERKEFIRLSAELMIDAQRFYHGMCRAIERWPRSCEHNFTTESMNRIAWLGHAGCCVEHHSPEDCTRAGWYWLTDAQMTEANLMAAKALALWRNSGVQLELLV